MIALLGYGAGPQFVVTFGFYTGAYDGPFQEKAAANWQPGDKAGTNYQPGDKTGTNQ